jgi:hypothetical protein
MTGKRRVESMVPTMETIARIATDVCRENRTPQGRQLW